MKKIFSITLVAVVLTTMLTGCTNTSTPTSTETKTFKIGVLAPLSGPAANYGEDAVNAYKYIVDKFNSENS
jgi:ABC-type branched-subunit amino acid transport system substrate-binding protein